MRGPRMRIGAVLSMAMWLMACGGGEGPPPEVSADLIEQHTRALSADEYAGRAPGTPGGDAAADHVAQAFAGIGLEPVNGSYFQEVPMIGSTPDPLGVELSFDVGDEREGPYEMTYLDDFVLWSGDPEESTADGGGELVFVGYGIDAPENEWDDYPVDVSGRVVLILVNDPPSPRGEPGLFGGEAMTYYGRWTYKYEEAARQGALGAIIIHTEEEAGYPWSVVRGGWSGEQFALPAVAGATPPVPLQGWITFASAQEVLNAAGYDLDQLIQDAGRREFRPFFTGIQVDAAVRSRVRSVETSNVVGLLPGSDRPDEVVTITSHYDHLGTGEPIDGDGIYNGAYDNASGTAGLIAIADALAGMDEPPARSILFIATGAEEQGLLGAEWYVRSPLFPLAQTVAEVNIDGINLWGETDDMVVMGTERSELGSFVEARAAEMGVLLAPDADPGAGLFFRSDHFPFARAGIPSLYVEHGWSFRGKPRGWGDQLREDYTATRYHTPEDEYDESWIYDGSVQHASLALRLALDIARAESWPNWNEDSEFRAARDAQRPGG